MLVDYSSGAYFLPTPFAGMEAGSSLFENPDKGIPVYDCGVRPEVRGSRRAVMSCGCPSCPHFAYHYGVIWESGAGALCREVSSSR